MADLIRAWFLSFVLCVGCGLDGEGSELFGGASTGGVAGVGVGGAAGTGVAGAATGGVAGAATGGVAGVATGGAAGSAIDANAGEACTGTEACECVGTPGYRTCDGVCRQTTDDLCCGQPGQWEACCATGCGVDVSMVSEYPNYFKNHPNCVGVSNCSFHGACSSSCPKPTDSDK